MRDISNATEGRMHVARIDDPVWLGVAAKRMTRELVNAHWLGADDKIDRCAHRLQAAYGVDAAIIRQCWNRPPREMLVSRWMQLFQAYCRWKLRRARLMARAAERDAVGNYEDIRDEVLGQGHPALVWLADLVAGRAAEADDREGR